MDIYTPFTYIIGWSQHKKFYYGAKYAQGCQPKDLWESYFTSSEYVKEFREENGEPDIIKIHRTFSDANSCVLFENLYLTKIDAKNHPLFLNESNGRKSFGVWNEKYLEKRRKTCIKKYGVKNVNQVEKIKNKTKQTCIEKYGTSNPQQNLTIREKTKKTCLEKYGYEYTLQSPEIKEKGKMTNIEKYGHEFAIQNQEVKEKSVTSVCKNYNVNVTNIFQVEEIKEKSRKTKLEKYGEEYYRDKEKTKQTWMENYGVDHPSKSTEIKEKKIKTSLNNWGYDHTLKVPEIREQIKQTCIDKYGVDNYQKTPEAKNESRERAKLQRAKEPVVICTHCNLSGKGPNMKRYHFDNCKNKMPK